jgi:hypothetical protein
MTLTTRKTATLFLEYQDIIEQSPIPSQNLYRQAASNDTVTVQSWKAAWVSQAKANHEAYGPFRDRSVGKFFRKHLHGPMFVLGSGPSLKKNAHLLKGDHGIPIISCLHNFHFLEDLGVKVDYYVSLDAGPVTIEEISEGGDPSLDYWEKTKGKVLLCYIGTHPDLLKKWQGEVYFFNCPIPELGVEYELDQIERFKVLVSSGGNVLGACMYIAKAIMGAVTTIFLGADFSFSYDEKFHSWDSKYDASLGNFIRVTDIYGNKVKSWQSYVNFKAFFDYVAQTVPGNYINCSEGGIFGAYPEGNIRAVRQMDLKDCIDSFMISEHIRPQIENPAVDIAKILY